MDRGQSLVSSVERSASVFFPPRCRLRAAHPNGDHEPCASTTNLTQPTAASICTQGPCTRTSLDDQGKKRIGKNRPGRPDALLDAVAPLRVGLVIGCKCKFA
jgi:hypothetical protein